MKWRLSFILCDLSDICNGLCSPYSFHGWKTWSESQTHTTSGEPFCWNSARQISPGPGLLTLLPTEKEPAVSGLYRKAKSQLQHIPVCSLETQCCISEKQAMSLSERESSSITIMDLNEIKSSFLQISLFFSVVDFYYKINLMYGLHWIIIIITWNLGLWSRFSQ